MNISLILTLILFPVFNNSANEEHPLKPLAKIDQSLARGMNAFLKGGSMEESFQGFDQVELVAKDLRESLKKGGVVSATPMGIEVDIDFVLEGKHVYRLGVFVHFVDERIEFFQFDGREIGSKEPSRHLATGNFPESQRALGKAFEAFVEALRGEDGDSLLQFPDAEALTKKMSSEQMRERIQMSIKKSKEGSAAVLAAVKGVKYDTLHARVDDQSFAAIGEDGSWLGIIRGELELDEKRGLRYQLDRYRPFP